MSDDTSIIVIGPEQEPPDLERSSAAILDLLSQGLTVQVIAARLQLDPTQVLSISDQMRGMQRQGEDGGEKLNRYSDQIDEIIDLAHWQCKAEPTPSHIYAYTAALEAARGVLQDLDGRRDPEKQKSEITKKVLEQLVVNVMSSMSQRLGVTRTELLGIVPPERSDEVIHQIEQILRALGSAFSDELQAAKGNLDHVLASTEPKQAKPIKMKSKMRG